MSIRCLPRSRGLWLAGLSLNAAIAAATVPPPPLGTASAVSPVVPATDYPAETRDNEPAPPWALGDNLCSATLITPRAALTTTYCAGVAELDVAPSTDAGAAPRSGPIIVARRRTGERLAGRWLDDAALWRAAPARLLLIVFDAPVRPLRPRGDRPEWPLTAPVPSYREEARLLRDPADAEAQDRKKGTHLHAYGPPSIQWAVAGLAPDRDRGTTVHNGYHRVWGDQQRQRMKLDVDMPLVYRSLAYTRRKEPDRFVAASVASAASASSPPHTDILERLVSRAVRNPTQADQWLLPLAGLASDRITRIDRGDPSPTNILIEPPFADADRGSGLMASRGPGRARSGKLVGLVSGPSALHIRLARHWTAVHRMLLSEGLRDDAEHLARQVLALKTWEQGGTARPGAIFGRRHPGTNELHFYRLLKLTEGGIYWNLPDDDTGNVWWQSLGTALPSRHAILGWRAPVSTMPPAIPASAPDAPLTPSPGNAP